MDSHKSCDSSESPMSSIEVSSNLTKPQCDCGAQEMSLDAKLWPHRARDQSSFTCFPTNFLFLVLDFVLATYHMTFGCQIALFFSNLWQFLFPDFRTFDMFWSVILRNGPQIESFWCFLRNRLSLCIWAKNTTEVMDDADPQFLGPVVSTPSLHNRVCFSSVRKLLIPN